MDWLPLIPLWVTCGACRYKLKDSIMEGHVFAVWIGFSLPLSLQANSNGKDGYAGFDRFCYFFHINIR